MGSRRYGDPSWPPHQLGSISEDIEGILSFLQMVPQVYKVLGVATTAPVKMYHDLKRKPSGFVVLNGANLNLGVTSGFGNAGSPTPWDDKVFYFQMNSAVKQDIYIELYV